MKMKKQEEQKQSGQVHLHNVRFYNLTPRSIQVMAYNKIFNMLALCRNDGTIEIWDMKYAAHLQKVIPSTPGGSVEGIAWAGERLFSVGLAGELVEWNLQNLRPRRRQHLTGNALWCVDVNGLGTELAVGTEEGYINIVNIEDDQLQYKNVFDKQEGRVLCCKFDATGDFLVTGSVGAVRVWNVQTGHALHKMSVARAKEPNIIVWSVQVLRDFSIIAGDSAGYVTIWDGNNAAQLEAYQVLQADVLAIAVNEEEDLLMCSGIEPLVRIFAKTQIKREDMVFHRWIKFLQRNIHDHDVKALLCVGNRILSGGVDGYLGISSATKTRSDVAKYGPFLQNPSATLAAANKLILLRFTNKIELWQLGKTKAKIIEAAPAKANMVKSNSSRVLLPLEAMPKKLLELGSINSGFVVCAALSPDASWICYSTAETIRLLRLELRSPDDSDNVNAAQPIKQATLVHDVPEQFTASTHLHFTADGQWLVLVNEQSRQILIFALSVGNGNGSVLDHLDTIELGKHIKDTVSILTVSACKTYIVAAGADHNIAVWSRNQKGKKNYKHLLNLPRYTAATTALALHAELPRLVASFADGKIFEYDLEDMCFTCSTNDHFVDSMQHYPISNILLDARNPNVFIMHNDSTLFVLEKHVPTTDTTAIEDALEDHNSSSTNTLRKKATFKKAKSSLSDSKVAGLYLNMQLKYEHFVHLSRLSPTELVAVGVNPISLLEQLPNGFRQKKFGIS